MSPKGLDIKRLGLVLLKCAIFGVLKSSLAQDLHVSLGERFLHLYLLSSPRRISVQPLKMTALRPFETL